MELRCPWSEFARQTKANTMYEQRCTRGHIPRAAAVVDWENAQRNAPRTAPTPPKYIKVQLFDIPRGTDAYRARTDARCTSRGVSKHLNKKMCCYGSAATGVLLRGRQSRCGRGRVRVLGGIVCPDGRRRWCLRAERRGRRVRRGPRTVLPRRRVRRGPDLRRRRRVLRVIDPS